MGEKVGTKWRKYLYMETRMLKCTCFQLDESILVPRPTYVFHLFLMCVTRRVERRRKGKFCVGEGSCILRQ